MAHNININNGVASFASSEKSPAWHGLGQNVGRAMTSQEALELAHLNFEVEKEPIFIRCGDQDIKIAGKYATTRKDTNVPLGVVGERYHVVQNTEAFDWFDNIVGSGEAYFETAGALGNGETIFITAKMPSHIQVGKDVIDQYLMLTNNHSGAKAVELCFTPVRVVCQNTLNAALKCCSNRVIVRHTSGVTEKMNQAVKAMSIANTYFDELSQALNAMKNVKIVDEQLKDFIRRSMNLTEVASKADREEVAKENKRTKDILDAVYVYALNDSTQAGIERTLYGAYNAVTGYYQNVKQWDDNESKLKSITEGRAFKAAQRAFEIALPFIQN
jgi:phage/plasmid-like protein (TIGR03299 family)